MSNNRLKYKNYIGTVDFNADDQVFFGKIFGINDLVTFEGETVKELINAFQEATDDYLVTCKELAKEPNKTFKGSFNVRLSTELHRKAAIVANQKSLTLNDFVKKAIDYAISHEQDIDSDFQTA